MTFEIIYYVFSFTTFLLVAYHMWNIAYYKRNNKNVFGMTFKKGSIEYNSMQKIISHPYIWITVAALPLSLFNLLLSVGEVFEIYNRKAAIILLVIYAIMILVGLICIFVVMRGIYGKDTRKGSKPKHKNSDDNDDW